VSKRSRRGASGTPRAGTGSGAGKSATGGQPGSSVSGSTTRASNPGSASATATTKGTSGTVSAVPGAFGNRQSSSPTGTPRAGRRARPVVKERSFLERYRTRLVVGGIALVAVVVAAFVLLSSNQAAYACSIQLAPASPVPPAPNATQALGQVEDDMGRTHVAVGTQVHYTYCPPASGNHYNAQGAGPIQPRYYGPNESAIPEGWVHNMEHGGLVILYNCQLNGCNAADQATLQAVPATFPASPVCKVPAGVISPVIARFDTMKTSFAALVWDHVLFQDRLDMPQILAFFNQYADRSNPENLYCNPNASPSPGATPITSPAQEPTTPAANPATTSSSGPGTASPA
jgi:hypothetical protein